MNTQLPEPPALIKISNDSTVNLDLRNPRHAKAYLLAIGHFLSGWPQEWTAERLACALVDDDSPLQCEVKLWDCVKAHAYATDADPYLLTDELACSLAQDILDF